MATPTAPMGFRKGGVGGSPCNRARIDFHDCWACGRHPSGLWPSSWATARGFGPARLAWALLCSRRLLSTHHSQEPREPVAVELSLWLCKLAAVKLSLWL